MVSVLVKKNLEMCEQMSTLVDSLKKEKPNSSNNENHDQQGSWAERLGARTRNKTPVANQTVDRIRRTEDYRSQSPSKRMRLEEQDEQ